ncbi:hypothetical protein LQ567_13725 [Niabella pedocola]|uniref:Outer membrane protein beta-barrel domain-containing protein n=1 Tax=Niabella pedocola TaxID=1752077 RepID=A0ABS8PRW5_9BACT|nr:hypothetical protein [Niabella pedocola]MCD2423830.1 hypothetical protein [Niabella pedocola]
MKKPMLTCCLLVLAGCAFGQEQLITLKNDTINAFVIKRGRHSIVYNLPGDSSGRRYRIGRQWVRPVDTRTGPHSSFRERANGRLRRPAFEAGSNLLASGIKRFGINDGITAVYMSYERRFFFNRLSAVIAPQVALNKAAIGGAAGIRYSPNPQARVNFFVGNDLLIWNEDQRYYNMEHLPDKTYITRSVTKKVNRGGLLFSTGCKINAGKKWVVAPELGGGIPLWKSTNTVWKEGLQYQREQMLMETVWQAQIGVGYRF